MAWVNTSPLVKTYTIDEFWRLPESPDGSKLELIAGVLFVTPPPEHYHDNTVSKLADLLLAHKTTNGIGGKFYFPRAAIWTAANTYLEPDLFYVSDELEIRLDAKRRNSADLVIEVVSPGSAVYDRNTKADTYGALGVRELWLVDYNSKALEVRRSLGNEFGPAAIFRGGERIQSDVFPALDITVSQVFES